MKKLYRSNGVFACISCLSWPITLSFLVSLLFTVTSYAQINAYAKVTAIATVSGKSQLTLTNINQTYHNFTVGEQVVVIQMQDNVISGTSNNSSFGLLSSIGKAGLYENAAISAISGSTMTLTKTLTNTFAFGSNSSVQVVSFNYLTDGGASLNYSTTGNMTALAWNGSLGTGGVIAFQVPGILTLKHSVSADGKGFAGGAASTNYSATCDASTYISSSTIYGAKGEGIYLINTASNPTYVRGRARILTGGGGAASYGGGGGGGSNYSSGGNGGSSWACNGSNDPSGLGGGVALGTYLTTGTRVFMGGGGGGGQGDATQTAGGNGGGIVIIKAATLTTSCGSSVKITANGNSTSSASSDGAGGAGAAGTILLQVNAYSVPTGCPLNIQANGGDGGDAGGLFTLGGGGGGGQGAILFTGTQPTSHITSTTTRGSGGANGWFGGNAGTASGVNNAGVIGGIGVVLPAQLLYFAAENKNNKAVLNWTSTNESNVTYTIERSADGIEFTAIGTVKGAGSGNYTFTDPNLANGKNFYRIQISGDLGAKTTYSSIVSLSLSEILNIPVAYPNPAHDHFYIRVNGENNNKIHVITITDLAGKIIFTTTGKPAGNIIPVTPGRSLIPGLYMFKVSCDGSEQTGKLMIR